ncbi:biopolymer transporter ExbD [Pseudoflavitalea sp. G-6-1-2]|uniref:ExbD/TolR family protein n=1 Tax=Pseudoflavitalea sp. G-6-1-2 TaxID=2728841 RepID=UPI00146BD5B2|nr:biopolymer transporter ExbD [Pseudoflavitalea sp. G-6-1-2]NML19275.1 biopolymer transporter ExbD [Pseudoflavitalea sp. G-6-1-2]
MPRVKVPRKSTSVDMTAMCDVAFLLLSFFILTTKFKASDALAVTTPKSVSTKVVDNKNVVLITMDKEGKAYISLGDEDKDEKEAVIDLIDQWKGLSLTAAEKKSWLAPSSYIGVPFSQLKSFLQLTPDQVKNFKSPGIPVTDTANNEMEMWVRAVQSAYQGKKMNLLLKGDNDAKYPVFKGIMTALKKNEIFKFSMVTDPQGVPEGTDLWKTNQRNPGKATDAE